MYDHGVDDSSTTVLHHSTMRSRSTSWGANASSAHRAGHEHGPTPPRAAHRVCGHKVPEGPCPRPRLRFHSQDVRRPVITRDLSPDAAQVHIQAERRERHCNGIAPREFLEGGKFCRRLAFEASMFPSERTKTVWLVYNPIRKVRLALTVQQTVLHCPQDRGVHNVHRAKHGPTARASHCYPSLTRAGRREVLNANFISIVALNRRSCPQPTI